MRDSADDVDGDAIEDSGTVSSAESGREALGERARRLVPRRGRIGQVNVEQRAVFRHFAEPA